MPDFFREFGDGVVIFFEDYLGVVLFLLFFLGSIFFAITYTFRRSQAEREEKELQTPGLLYRLIYGQIATETNIAGLASFLGVIHGKLGKYRTSFEFSISPTDISTYFWIPRTLESDVLLWAKEYVPDLMLQPCSDDHFLQDCSAHVIQVKPTKPFEPYVIANNFTGDPIGFLEQLSRQIPEGGRVCIQLQQSLPAKKILHQFDAFIHSVKSGQASATPPKKENFFVELLREFLKIFTTLPAQVVATPEASADVPKELSDEEKVHLEALERKRADLPVLSAIAIGYSRETIPVLQQLTSCVEDFFQQFSKGSENTFTFSPVINPIEAYALLVARRPWSSSPFCLSTQEILPYFRFPTSVENPKLAIAGKALLQSVPAVLHYSEHDPSLLKIGQVQRQGQLLTVGLSLEDFRRNYLILGKPRQGKTTYAMHAVLQQFHHRGKTLIFDTKGTMSQQIVEQLFEQKKNVILVDFHQERVLESCSLQPFHLHPELLPVMVALFKDLYAPLFSQESGPVIEYVLERVLMTVGLRRGVLFDIPYLLTNTSFRQEYCKGIVDERVLAFWATDYPKVEQQFVAVSNPLVAMHNDLYGSRVIQALLGKRIQERTLATLFATYDVVMVQTAALTPFERKVITNVMLLEMLSLQMTQNITGHVLHVIEDANLVLTKNIANLCAAKYTPYHTMMLLSETLASLDSYWKKTIQTQGFHRIFFPMVLEENSALHEFDAVFDTTILTALDPFHAYTRLVVQGELTRLFLLKSMPLEKPDLMQKYFRNFFQQL